MILKQQFELKLTNIFFNFIVQLQRLRKHYIKFVRHDLVNFSTLIYFKKFGMRIFLYQTKTLSYLSIDE